MTALYVFVALTFLLGLVAMAGMTWACLLDLIERDPNDPGPR